MTLPSDDILAALRAKHGVDLSYVECDLGTVIFKCPTEAEVDPYLVAKYVSGEFQDGANNLVFGVRVWPSVAKVDEMFEEAPALVGKFASEIEKAYGGDEADMAGARPRKVSELTETERGEFEAALGPLAELEARVPRGTLRLVRMPFGPAAVRRPTRHSYAKYSDAYNKPGAVAEARQLIFDSAVAPDAKAFAECFKTAPMLPFYLALNLAAQCGTELQARAGKLKGSSAA